MAAIANTPQRSHELMPPHPSLTVTESPAVVLNTFRAATPARDAALPFRGNAHARREASSLVTSPPPQCRQRLGGIAAHPGREQQQQRTGPAQYLGALDHPDEPAGHRLEGVVEDDLAQRHRALTHPVPSGADFDDGEGAAEIAALPGPATRPRLTPASELGDRLPDLPLRPARHVGPHLP